MRYSKHAQARMRHRGISQEKLDLILEHGRLFPVAGGADLCMITGRQITERINVLKKEVSRWESLKDTGLIIGADGTVITVEHHTRRHRVAS